MGNYFIEQIEYGLSQIDRITKARTIRAIIITKPNDTTGGAYLKIDWITNEAPKPQTYGTPIGLAGNIAEIISDLHEAAAHFGCDPKNIKENTFLFPKYDPGRQEAFSNRGHSFITDTDKEVLFEIHEPPDLIYAAKLLGWRRWVFKPTDNI